MKRNINYTKIIAVSGVCMAIYIAIMFLTQSFAFGSIQIRIATAVYSLSYVFPFLVLPMGLANGLGNLLGGFGVFDIVGGFLVGIITSGAIALIKKFKPSKLFIIPALITGPGLIVPIWLSFILNIPYIYLAGSLCLGQVIPAIAGYFIVIAAERANIGEDYE